MAALPYAYTVLLHCLYSCQENDIACCKNMILPEGRENACIHIIPTSGSWWSSIGLVACASHCTDGSKKFHQSECMLLNIRDLL